MIAQSLKSFSAGRLFAVGSSQLRSFCTATSVISEAMASEVEEDAPSAGGTSADKENSKKTMWNLYSQLSTIRATKGPGKDVTEGDTSMEVTDDEIIQVMQIHAYTSAKLRH